MIVRRILTVFVGLIAAGALFTADKQYGWIPIPSVCDASDYGQDPSTGKIVIGSDCPSIPDPKDFSFVGNERYR
jgi:hypothetical protein